MKKLPNHTALKEWSTVIDALGAGQQVILIRKGGIADPAFGVEAERFYLYPTYFHLGEEGDRRGVRISHWAEVIRIWTLEDLDSLFRLAPHVMMPRAALETRYRFRSDQKLIVMGLRTWALAHPADLVYRDSYGGCRSWISLDEEVDTEGSLPVLTSAALERRINEIDALLTATV